MLEQELEAAVEAALLAGSEVARLRREGVRYGRKGGWELVSEADLRAAEILHETLTARFPGTGWLSEEHVDDQKRLDHDRVWVVDPIDGTREYLQGIPEYAVSVGLVVEGRPALGVVHNPATGELAAASCLDAQERTNSVLTPHYEVLVGRGEHRRDEIPMLPSGAHRHPIGSVAYRLALLAGGKGHAVLTGFGRSEWDVAAGAALCLAAGMRVTDIFGEPIRYNQPDPQVRGLLAAAPALHGVLARHFGGMRYR